MPETATVADVVDGDTIDVELDDGSTETVRILGIDTPETTDNVEAERRAEWEGIENLSYLGRWGDAASEFAKTELSGATVRLKADANEPNRGSYGRLLRYVKYDPDGSGDRSTVYNRRAIATGYARVYDSGFARHDAYLQQERTAREDSRHVWTRSNPAATPPIRDHPVDQMFVPRTASIITENGSLAADRTPVFASKNATQRDDPNTTYESDIPLVGVDPAAHVAMVGGPLIDEQYEQAEGFAVDTSQYGNFPFLTNLLDSLTDRNGAILVDGGHGQFNAEFSLSVEDTAYYLRYLEGQGISLRQVNTLADSDLTGCGLIITTPAEAFSEQDFNAIRSFRDAGGAVILLGHGTEGMPSDARDHLNEVATNLGTDLRLNADRVVDEESNLNSNPALPTTTNFNTSFDLFDPVTSTPEESGSLTISAIEPSGDGENAVTGEQVVLKNTTGHPLDLTGWRIEDETGTEYHFPDGVTLPQEMEVAVHTNEGDDITNLYWDRSQAVWNDAGDTVAIYDAADTLVQTQSY
jgi:endonuclease YncB( thermonuclease family)